MPWTRGVACDSNETEVFPQSLHYEIFTLTFMKSEPKRSGPCAMIIKQTFFVWTMLLVDRKVTVYVCKEHYNTLKIIFISFTSLEPGRAVAGRLPIVCNRERIASNPIKFRDIVSIFGLVHNKIISSVF